MNSAIIISKGLILSNAVYLSINVIFQKKNHVSIYVLRFGETVVVPDRIFYVTWHDLYITQIHNNPVNPIKE